jgi:hypothetical protein
MFGQIVGICATLVSLAAWQVHTKRSVLFCQCVGNALWILHFFLIGAYVGSILNIVTLILVFSGTDNNQSHVKFYRVGAFFAGAAGFAVAAKFFDWHPALLDLCPFTAVIIYAIAVRLSDIGFRYVNLLGRPLWLIYNIIHGSVGGTVTEIGLLASSIIGIIRYVRIERRMKEKPLTQPSP